jgi:hypothetical protein
MLSVLIVIFSGDAEEDIRWEAERCELDALLRGVLPVRGIVRANGYKFACVH